MAAVVSIANREYVRLRESLGAPPGRNVASCQLLTADQGEPTGGEKPVDSRL